MIFSWSKITVFFLMIAAIAFLLYPSEYFRGMMHRRDADRNVSIAFYENFLHKNPYHKGATLALAAAYESIAQPEAAAAIMASFCRHRRGDLKMGLEYLALLENSGRLEEARALRWSLYQDAKGKPSVPRSDLEALLYAAYQKAVLAQNDEERLKTLTALTEVAKNPASYFSQIVSFYMARRKFPELISIFSQRISKKPADIEARRNLIYVYRVQGNHEAALREIDAALKISSGTLDFLKERVAVHALQGRFGLTLPDLRRLVARVPEEALWRHDLADNAFKSLPLEEAAAVCRGLIEKNPDDLMLLDLLVYQYQSAGKKDQALAVLKSHLVRRPQDAQRRRQWAFLQVEARKFDEARGALADLVERDSSDQEAWWALIYGYSDRKMNKDAARWLEKYLEKFPEDPKAHDMLVQSYLLLNDKEKAISLLKNYFAPSKSGESR